MHRVGVVTNIFARAAARGFGRSAIITNAHTIPSTLLSTRTSSYRHFASTPKPPLGPNDAIPDDFFDEEVENEKELLDHVAAMEAGVEEVDDYDDQKIPGMHSVGLGSLTTKFATYQFSDMDKESDTGIPVNKPQAREQQLYAKSDAVSSSGDEMSTLDIEDNDRDRAAIEEFELKWEKDPSREVLLESMTDPDFAASLDGIEQYNSGHEALPQEFLSYNLPWRRDLDHPQPLIAKSFMAKSDPDLYRFDHQSLRTCTGKKQRQGPVGNLNCHLIDLDDLSHFDVEQLQKFLSPDSEILSRKLTGLCAKCQRQVAKTIKRARNLGVFPHINEYVIKDQGWKERFAPFRTPVNVTVTKVSKTIL
jgi:small subunit ribosomal protein S18